jgi:hypothetical protein
MWFGLGLGLLGLTGLKLLAQPPNGPGPDPAKTWRKRTQKVAAQFGSDLSVSEQKACLAWEIAGEERRLNLLHAAHERAASLWLAAETYRASAHDPASRQAYLQAAGAAHQQYSQAIGTAHQTWSQAVSQSHQAWQQEGATAHQTAQTDLAAAWQSFAQSLPTYEEVPEAMAWDDWQLPGTPLGMEPTEAEKTLTEALKEARTKYRTALQEATAAWQQTTQQVTQQFQLEEDETASQLRKANRVWLTAALDALEDLRADFRSAQRKYQLSTMPE